MNEQAMEPNPNTSLSHLEREHQAQFTRRLISHITTEDLRKLRAWLLDVVQNEMTCYLELATLRGELVHKAVEEQESKRFRTAIRMFGSPTHKKSLKHLATFADLEPPASLVR